MSDGKKNALIFTFDSIYGYSAFHNFAENCITKNIDMIVIIPARKGVNDIQILKKLEASKYTKAFSDEFKNNNPCSNKEINVYDFDSSITQQYKIIQQTAKNILSIFNSLKKGGEDSKIFLFRGPENEYNPYSLNELIEYDEDNLIKKQKDINPELKITYNFKDKESEKEDYIIMNNDNFQTFETLIGGYGKIDLFLTENYLWLKILNEFIKDKVENIYIYTYNDFYDFYKNLSEINGSTQNNFVKDYIKDYYDKTIKIYFLPYKLDKIEKGEEVKEVKQYIKDLCANTSNINTEVSKYYTTPTYENYLTYILTHFLLNNIDTGGNYITTNYFQNNKGNDYNDKFVNFLYKLIKSLLVELATGISDKTNEIKKFIFDIIKIKYDYNGTKDEANIIDYVLNQLEIGKPQKFTADYVKQVLDKIEENLQQGGGKLRRKIKGGYNKEIDAKIKEKENKDLKIIRYIKTKLFENEQAPTALIHSISRNTINEIDNQELEQDLKEYLKKIINAYDNTILENDNYIINSNDDKEIKYYYYLIIFFLIIKKIEIKKEYLKIYYGIIEQFNLILEKEKTTDTITHYSREEINKINTEFDALDNYGDKSDYVKTTQNLSVVAHKYNLLYKSIQDNLQQLNLLINSFATQIDDIDTRRKIVLEGEINKEINEFKNFIENINKNNVEKKQNGLMYIEEIIEGDIFAKLHDKIGTQKLKEAQAQAEAEEKAKTQSTPILKETKEYLLLKYLCIYKFFIDDANLKDKIFQTLQEKEEFKSIITQKKDITKPKLFEIILV